MLAIPADIMPAVARVIEDAENALKPIFNIDIKVRIELNKDMYDLDIIAMLVCEHFNVSWLQVSGPSRKRKTASARHMYCFLCRRLTAACLRQIGDRIGRDHTSVIHACNTVSDLLQAKDVIATTAFNEIIQRFKTI